MKADEASKKKHCQRNHPPPKPRVTFPAGVAPYFPRFQSLEIRVAGIEVPEHLDILVAPPPSNNGAGGG